MIDTSKFSSGKFLFTIITALVFAYCSVTKILAPDKIMEIILIVVYGYFTRNNNTIKPS